MSPQPDEPNGGWITDEVLDRLECWVNSRVRSDLRCRIDVQQIVNDALFQWLDVQAEPPSTEVVALPPLLRRIILCRVSDAIRHENRVKRLLERVVSNEMVLQVADPRPLSVELDLQDLVEFLLVRLTRLERAVLVLRYSGYNESEIARQIGNESCEVRSLRQKIAEIADVIQITSMLKVNDSGSQK